MARIQNMILTAIATSLAGFVLPLQSFAATYQVTQVLSGDTLRVENRGGNFMVRLIGIDAPKGPPDDQPFSERAKTHLASIVQNQMVEIYSYGFDDAGRMLGLVFANDRNVNLDMVKAGLAEVDRGELTSSFDLGPYRAEEREAKAAKRGMWILGNKYVSPRNWIETGDRSIDKKKETYIKKIVPGLEWFLSQSTGRGNVQSKNHEDLLAVT